MCIFWHWFKFNLVIGATWISGSIKWNNNLSDCFVYIFLTLACKRQNFIINVGWSKGKSARSVGIGMALTFVPSHHCNIHQRPASQQFRCSSCSSHHRSSIPHTRSSADSPGAAIPPVEQSTPAERFHPSDPPSGFPQGPLAMAGRLPWTSGFCEEKLKPLLKHVSLLLILKTRGTQSIH